MQWDCAVHLSGVLVPIVPHSICVSPSTLVRACSYGDVVGGGTDGGGGSGQHRSGVGGGCSGCGGWHGRCYVVGCVGSGFGVSV